MLGLLARLLVFAVLLTSCSANSFLHRSRPSLPHLAAESSSSPSSSPSSAPSCGIGSYDFSSLTSGRSWVGLSYDYSEIYYLSLCHIVSELWCTLNDNTASVQVCQVNTGDTSVTYSVMSNDTAATRWSYINGQDAADGVRFEAQTGDAGAGCPRNSRRVAIGNLVCGNSSGVLADITEAPACTYTMTIPTATLCREGQQPQYVEEVERMRLALSVRRMDTEA